MRVSRPISVRSIEARRRIQSGREEPLFIADWERTVMIHFETDPEELQGSVPFELELFDGRAFVSVVAFTMRGLKPRFGGRLAAWLCRPIATHEFLNVRTYVRDGDETGIHFLAEWVPNRLAVGLGPVTFGLPYRYARMEYRHDWRTGRVRGCVIRETAALVYEAATNPDARFGPCTGGSLDEWLMERYTAFTCCRGRPGFFRVWHPPWPQCPVEPTVVDASLLRQNWRWFESARLAGGNYSPGVSNVWMGWPHRIGSPPLHSIDPGISGPGDRVERAAIRATLAGPRAIKYR
jgi:hypothetical protein